MMKKKPISIKQLQTIKETKEGELLKIVNDALSLYCNSLLSGNTVELKKINLGLNEQSTDFIVKSFNSTKEWEVESKESLLHFKLKHGTV